MEKEECNRGEVVEGKRNTLKVVCKTNLVLTQPEKTGTDEKVQREVMELDVEIREDSEDLGLLTALNQNVLHAISEGRKILKK